MGKFEGPVRSVDERAENTQARPTANRIMWKTLYARADSRGMYRFNSDGPDSLGWEVLQGTKTRGEAAVNDVACWLFWSPGMTLRSSKNDRTE